MLNTNIYCLFNYFLDLCKDYSKMTNITVVDYMLKILILNLTVRLIINSNSVFKDITQHYRNHWPNPIRPVGCCQPLPPYQDVRFHYLKQLRKNYKLSMKVNLVFKALIIISSQTTELIIVAFHLLKRKVDSISLCWFWDNRESLAIIHCWPVLISKILFYHIFTL